MPLIIRDTIGYGPPDVDNIIAALEHNDRVCRIRLESFTSLILDSVTNLAAMQKPFPELRYLWLCKNFGEGPILPDTFLGGTAPRMQSLILHVPFPGLQKLLVSATHLVNLDLYRIPSLGYIPLEAMATSLAALINLECFRLHFLYPPPRRTALETRRFPTRSILPSLTKILLRASSEYLEAILARIDAPQIDELRITFFNQTVFDTPKLFQLINRTPRLRTPEKGHIDLYPRTVTVGFPRQTFDYGVLEMEILCAVSEWQLSSLEQVCTSSLPPVSTLKDLYILDGSFPKLCWQDDVEYTLWLELLRPFAAVKNLYICKQFVPHIAPVLQELVGGRTTEVLPILEYIFLKGLQSSGRLHEGIEKFITARRLTSHSLAVSRWDN